MKTVFGKLKESRMKLIYLACPYTHEDVSVREERTKEVTRVAARLMLEGFNVFSPITHSHYINDFMPEEIKCDFDFWIERDFQILDGCDELFVLCLDGWRNSKGVKAEISFAKKKGIPITYLVPKNYYIFH
jgi:nucleoside 2-deoxyribosyltransferase